MLQQPRLAVPVGPKAEGTGAEPAARPRGAPRYEAQCVVIDDQGHASYASMRKQRLVSELHLRHRDIRALEPGVALPYPAAIFVRKQALVLNLEGLKVIITRDRTLVISVPPPHDLSVRLKPSLDSLVVSRLAGMIAMRYDLAGGPEGTGSLEELRYVASLPYELRALEAALLLAVTILSAEVAALEGATHPVLARIRAHVGRDDLEAVYDTQNRLDKAISRVARVKEVLEELLDDEDEMARMCLSRYDVLATPSAVIAAAAVAAAANGAAPGEEGKAREAVPVEPEQGGQDVDADATGTDVGSDASVGNGGDGGAGGSGDGGAPPPPPPPPLGVMSPSHSLKCHTAAVDVGEEEVAELEDMIEAHWLQVDSLLSRLKILQEKIRNTEHLVNLDLDSKRNALVALGLLIDVALMAAEIHMAVTGIFGMNLTSGLEPYEPYSLWAVVVTAAVLGGALSALTLHYVRRRGLLFLSTFGLQSPRAGAAPAAVGAAAV